MDTLHLLVPPLSSRSSPTVVVKIPHRHVYVDEFVDESTVRYNEVQWKAAHNSVERDESIFEQMDFKDGNCGAIELDFVIDPKSVNILDARQEEDKMTSEERERYDGWRFSVQHNLRYHSDAAVMVDVLTGLRQWSIDHPNHTVVTVHLDMKQAHVGTDTVFIQQIDDAIIWGLGRERIFAPGDLMKDAETLVEGARRYGWPTLKQLQNKFILVISGADNLGNHVRKRRELYSTTEPAKRICFVDIDQRGCPSVKGYKNSDLAHPYYHKGDRIFVNIQHGNHDWEKLGREVAESGYYISRLWKANHEHDWDLARRAKIHLIATNQIRNHPWASISRKNKFAVLSNMYKEVY